MLYSFLFTPTQKMEMYLLGIFEVFLIEQLSCSCCRLPPVALHAQRLCWLSSLVNVVLEKGNRNYGDVFYFFGKDLW